MVLKYSYDHKAKEWSQKALVVAIGQPVGKGAMRTAYRMNDLSNAGDFVAKSCSVPGFSQADYFSDVVMQGTCIQLASAYNKRGTPKKATFLEAFLIERVNKPGKPLMACEKRLKGEWVKFNNNDGFVSPDDRNTPQSFSHFTHYYTEGKLMVVDIQGVIIKGQQGEIYIYTDPQIHSIDRRGYGKGNCGREGMERFFRTHKCNDICVGLKLCERAQQQDFRGTMMEVPKKQQAPAKDDKEEKPAEKAKLPPRTPQQTPAS